MATVGKKRVRSLSCAGKPDWIVSSLHENSFARMKYTDSGSGFTAKINLECFHPTYNPEEVFVDVADNELQINARKEDPADPYAPTESFIANISFQKMWTLID
ncbi:hypothetical protein L596_013137 [Steinernema carpocapsae]|uniref:SHSP domain-containing protein n=1 Tax=Steinernema carpocapsae TaxID=34508 RepID=A0A4U5NZG6_STECR|nr:hypothetical protein L596_013137 [Steinernema carpocapsae]